MDLLTSLLPSRRRVRAVVIRSTRVSPGLQRLVPGGPDLAPDGVWMAGEVAWVARWKAYWRQHLDAGRVFVKGYWRPGGPL